jgi:hypothetical protein
MLFGLRSVGTSGHVRWASDLRAAHAADVDGRQRVAPAPGKPQDRGTPGSPPPRNQLPAWPGNMTSNGETERRIGSTAHVLMAGPDGSGGPTRIAMSVIMVVIAVGVVLVPVDHRLMRVKVAVPGSRRDGLVVLVLVVFIMDVLVFMGDRWMGVGVLVSLGQMQPRPDRHQRGRGQQRPRDWIAQGDGEERSEEWAVE